MRTLFSGFSAAKRCKKGIAVSAVSGKSDFFFGSATFLGASLIGAATAICDFFD